MYKNANSFPKQDKHFAESNEHLRSSFGRGIREYPPAPPDSMRCCCSYVCSLTPISLKAHVSAKDPMPNHSHAHLHETKNEHHKGEPHKSHQSIEHPVSAFTAVHPHPSEASHSQNIKVLAYFRCYKELLNRIFLAKSESHVSTTYCLSLSAFTWHTFL